MFARTLIVSLGVTLAAASGSAAQERVDLPLGAGPPPASSPSSPAEEEIAEQSPTLERVRGLLFADPLRIRRAPPPPGGAWSLRVVGGQAAPALERLVASRAGAAGIEVVVLVRFVRRVNERRADMQVERLIWPVLAADPADAADAAAAESAATEAGPAEAAAAAEAGPAEAARGEGAGAGLTGALGGEQGSAPERVSAEDVARVLRLCESKHPDVRRAGVDELRRLVARDRRLLVREVPGRGPLLGVLLQSEHQETREGANEHMQRLDLRAAPAVWELAARSPYPLVRSSAGVALELRVRDRDLGPVRPFVAQALRSKDEVLREAGGLFLRRRGGELMDLVDEHLESKHLDVRLAAQEGLARRR